MTGDYELLNEQPVRPSSNLRFICLTDNPSLTSETWEIHPIRPLFPNDSVRSQRDVKIRPHRYLPNARASLYMDNSVLLTEVPERVIEAYAAGTDFAIPRHSFRDSVLAEFLEVERLGYDDPARIREQLEHYTLANPPVLEERPFWSGVLLRDHESERGLAAMDAWAAHVHRYSRRDQLSANFAFRLEGLNPRVIDIDTMSSWFHSWPHTRGRAPISVPESDPLVARLRREQQDAEARVAALAAQNATLLEQAAIRDASASGQIASALRAAARRWPGPAKVAARAALGIVRRARSIAHPTPRAKAAEVNHVVGSAGRVIYVNTADGRGQQLLASGGYLNPPTLDMWRQLLADGSWSMILDVGANYGELLLNVELPSHAKIVAVEPNPAITPYLRRSLDAAKLPVEIIECAVAKSSGHARLLVDESWSGNSRLAEGDARAIEVTAMTLAEIIERFAEPSATRLLLKLDIEGFECDALRGGMDVLPRLKEFRALVEILHAQEVDLAWLLTAFQISLLRLDTGIIEDIFPASVEEFRSLVASSTFYGNDVAIRNKSS